MQYNKYGGGRTSIINVEVTDGLPAGVDQVVCPLQICVQSASSPSLDLIREGKCRSQSQEGVAGLMAMTQGRHHC